MLRVSIGPLSDLDTADQIESGDYSLLRKCIADIVKGKGEIPDDDNEFLGLVGTLLTEHLLEKQKIIELSREEVIPCLIRLMESLE